MKLPIPEIVKKLWGVWNLRGGVLLSLTLQLLLTLLASRRQRSRNSLLLIFIWLAYLLADWVAAVSIGLVIKAQSDSCRHKGNDDVLAFWASFLLIHLGGPDSITSFALEDNEFWLRHVIELVLQVSVAGYSFFLTLPQNKLWLPTVLVFILGTIKFAERTFALYWASSDHFAETILPQPNPGPDYEEAVEIYSDMRSVEVQTRPAEKKTTAPNVGNYGKEANKKDKGKEESLDQKIKLLNVAHKNFKRFKGLIVGLLLSSKERESSRTVFLHHSAKEAFSLTEYELSFIYQVLHTKVVVVRHKFGYILRILSLLSIVGALMMFYFVEKKKDFVDFDIVLTYALLIGAISVDIISVFNLIFSKWTLIGPINKWRKAIAKIALRGKRWSGKVSQYNMIRYCLDERPGSCFNKLAGCLYFRGIVDRIKLWRYSSTKTVDDNLKSFIFDELRTKSSTVITSTAAMEACSQRGDWALLQTSSYMNLKWSVGEFQYAESLLIWHIATELCYHSQDKSESEVTQSKEICKLLSDYMFSLLAMQNSMLAPVLGNWHIVFHDTCAEANRFFTKKSISDHSKACEKIIDVKTHFRPAAVKGSKSKSVFFEAPILAKQLRELEANEYWKLMSRVWVELMSYAAINCRPIVHAQQPSKGGELLTFTWLLMNHLGLGTQFYEQEQQAGTKMVATK